jgi:hypothetical protein
MLYTFVFEGVGVVVGPWNEPATPPERGARVELRTRVVEPHRGSQSAAQRVVLDLPLFRADLFDQVDGPPGNLRAAHFHAGFDGVEPRDRLWPPELRENPVAWLEEELGDLGMLVARHGLDAGCAPWLDSDADALRQAIPAIVAAVESTWASVRSETPA